MIQSNDFNLVRNGRSTLRQILQSVQWLCEMLLMVHSSEGDS